MKETVEFLYKKKVNEPEIGIILGTGLGKLVDEVEIEIVIDYSEIPNYPIATVEFHSGKLVFGKLGGKQVVVMQGRFHYYEGYSMQEITFPVRVLKQLGINYLLISNAAGAMNLEFKKGSLMLIDDHINILPENPLCGQNFEELGPRFPDMSQPYSVELNQKLIKVAKKNNIVLKKGVYVCVQGPNLETRAEYRYLHAAGADVVGMSTVPEVIVANHMNIPCVAISVITDECDPNNLIPIDISEIIAVAGEAEKDLIMLFKKLINEL
ncbi:purine-nucleoside phosphorylase [Bacteroidota bacterium]